MALSEQLDKLAAFEPVPYPVVSLYLDTRPDQRGRDAWQTFIRKEFKARAATYPAGSPDHDSLNRDLERISAYLDAEVRPSANGVAIFACNAAHLFETVQVDAPIEKHSLYIGERPYLYPLARLVSQYPRYAAVLADTNSARILVIAEGGIEGESSIKGVKTRRSSQGGSSQARYQRHLENYHLQHVKEVVDALERIVQREGIDKILIAGDPVVIPIFREQLPKHLAEKVVDELSLRMDAPPYEIIGKTLESMGKLNERTDRERVNAAVGAYRAGGLGVVGPDETLLALTNGQVDELLISASLSQMKGLRGTRAAEMALANDAGLAEPAVEPVAAGEPGNVDLGTLRLAEELVAKARQTGATVTFIEDPSLLAAYGGVAGLLRYLI